MSSKTIKEFYKEKVTKEGMTEEYVRKSNSTFYTNNFEAVSRWRKKYLLEYAPIPEFKTNIYICGPGGIGKTVASRAVAKSLFPDAVNPYFQTFAKTRNLKWYDGQPVIIWDNCKSSDLLRMFGRQKLFDILDPQPTDTKCKTNSGSVRLVNSINIINSTEPYDEFLNGLCKSKEDKDQVYKLFPIIMELHGDDYDILYNADLFPNMLRNLNNRKENR